MSILNFRKDQYPILYANAVALAIFATIFSIRKDYEFLGYIGVIFVVIAFVNATNRWANYSNALSWVLSVWGWMHLAGKAVYIGGIRLYDIILIPIYKPLEIFKYDQLVHSMGMIAATIGLYYIFKSILKPEHTSNWKMLSLLLIASGLGIGVSNEIVEFILSIFIENTGVGGYINNSVDQLANLMGVMIAIAYLRSKDLGANGKINSTG